MSSALTIVLALLLLPGRSVAQIGPDGAATAPAPAPAAPTTVRLVIDYGEGVEKHYSALPHRPGMTVADLLKDASALPPPRGLAFDASGSGERFFVKAIDGLANEGAGKTARNWIYALDGEMGKVSAGVAKVDAGAKVHWRFRAYDWSAPAE